MIWNFTEQSKKLFTIHKASCLLSDNKIIIADESNNSINIPEIVHRFFRGRQK